jgi:hypothetical protein
LYGAVPAVAVSVCKYGTPTLPLGRTAVTIDGGGAAAAITIVKSRVAFCPAESPTRTVNDEAPAALGVPETDPFVARASPAGRDPLASVHE